ncbi:hypothetical protein [Azospirillum palustre]
MPFSNSLSRTNTDPNSTCIPILRNELDAGRFKSCLDGSKGARLKVFAALQARHSVNRYTGLFGKIADSPAYGRPRHLALNSSNRHDSVPISC